VKTLATNTCYNPSVFSDLELAACLPLRGVLDGPTPGALRAARLCRIWLGVDTEEPKDQAAFMEKFGYTFRSLVDANEKAKNLYHVGGIPTTVLIDKDGKIQTFDADGSSSLRETIRRMVTF